MVECVDLPGALLEPIALTVPEEHAGVAGWRNGGRDCWWLTVLIKGCCAHACVRRRGSGRWSWFMSRARHHGWQHEDNIDAGESLVEAMRVAERAIARLSASAM